MDKKKKTQKMKVEPVTVVSEWTDDDEELEEDFLIIELTEDEEDEQVRAQYMLY